MICEGCTRKESQARGWHKRLESLDETRAERLTCLPMMLVTLSPRSAMVSLIVNVLFSSVSLVCLRNEGRDMCLRECSTGVWLSI